MSKNNAYKNFNSPIKNSTKEHTEGIDASINSIATEEFEEKANESAEEETDIDKLTETKEPVLAEATTKPEVSILTKGMVICSRLNVREQPNKNAPVIMTINQGTKLEIDLEKSTEDFYNVVTSIGIEGYCMKQFVSFT